MRNHGGGHPEMNQEREIWHEILVAAPRAVLYTALTEVPELAHWWTTDTRGESKVGGRLEFWFGDMRQVMEVTALKPGELVRWRATDTGIADWVGTEIEFHILPQA